MKYSGLTIKVAIETIGKTAKEQKGVFFGMLLGILSASILGNILAGKDAIQAGGESVRTEHQF